MTYFRVLGILRDFSRNKGIGWHHFPPLPCNLQEPAGHWHFLPKLHTYTMSHAPTPPTWPPLVPALWSPTPIRTIETVPTLSPTFPEGCPCLVKTTHTNPILPEHPDYHSLCSRSRIPLEKDQHYLVTSVHLSTLIRLLI